jgi:hypothetical protein
MIFPQVNLTEAIELHIKAMFIVIISNNKFLLLSNSPPYFCAYDSVCYVFKVILNGFSSIYL